MPNATTTNANTVLNKENLIMIFITNATTQHIHSNTKTQTETITSKSIKHAETNPNTTGMGIPST
eukprot:8075668-Pyramimonas_sp.AAC.1